MLDQRMLYKDILMSCPKEIRFNNPILNDAYQFINFKDGDEISWAEIEVSAREFETIEEALNKFYTRFSNEKEQLYSSMIFIERKDTHEKIATALAWHVKTGENILPMLHFVAVKENYQGLGLGRKIVEKALYILQNKYPNQNIVLHTQTWSWHAILLYQKLGFSILKEGSFGHYSNKYEEAMIELEKYLDKEVIDRIKNGTK